MKAFITSILVSAGILLGVHAYFSETGMQRAVAVANSAMVQINENCSGVIVNAKRGIILTAAHCVSGVDNKPFVIEINHFDEDGVLVSKTHRYASLIKKETETSDIAVLVVTGGIFNVTEAPIATVSPKQGDKVYAVGNPLGYEGFVSEGIVAKTRLRWKDYYDKLTVDPTNMIFTAAIAPGSSGGVLLNENGEVIGITVNVLLMGGQLPTPFYGAATLNSINEIMEKVNG